MKTVFAMFIGSAFATLLIFAAERPGTQTFYLPNARQDSQPFCLSNRSQSDIQIPDGPIVRPRQTVNASVTHDFQWGFTQPVPSTDRGDVDCFVMGK